MTGRLRLQLLLATNRLAINAKGILDATTAHLLPKAVIGALRRFPAAVLAIDITHLSTIDEVGEIALDDCRREAEKRGLIFTIVGRASQQPVPASRRAAAKRRTWMRSHSTGTTCRPLLKR